MNADDLSLSLCQMCSTRDPAANLERAEAGLRDAAGQGADLALLPENVLMRGAQADTQAAARDVAAFDDQLGAITGRHGIVAVWGGVPVRRDGAVYNTSLVYDADGNRIGRYEKMHLFRFADGGTAVDETAVFSAGETPLCLTIKNWRVGISICYDLRFPELYRQYAGADLMVCTAEFTHVTGSAHWELLLRARAVENQCYMAGVGQCGMNEARQIRAYGHSMVVGPWGDVRLRAAESPEHLHAALPKAAIDEARNRVPALQSIAIGRRD